MDENNGVPMTGLPPHLREEKHRERLERELEKRQAQQEALLRQKTIKNEQQPAPQEAPQDNTNAEKVEHIEAPNNSIPQSQMDQLVRQMNMRMHAQQLTTPMLQGMEVREDPNPAIVFSASDENFTIMLCPDGYIADGEFEQRIEKVIASTKKYMESMGALETENSFAFIKDFSNPVFNFKEYLQDMVFDRDGKKIIIRNYIGYFVEPKMHDFYQYSLCCTPVEYGTIFKVGSAEGEISEAIINKLDMLLTNLVYKEELTYKPMQQPQPPKPAEPIEPPKPQQTIPAYDERMKKLAGPDPFFKTQLEKFMDAAFAGDRNEALIKIEKLFEDKEKYNAFLNVLFQRNIDYDAVKKEYFGN